MEARIVLAQQDFARIDAIGYFNTDISRKRKKYLVAVPPFGLECNQLTIYGKRKRLFVKPRYSWSAIISSRLNS